MTTDPRLGVWLAHERYTGTTVLQVPLLVELRGSIDPVRLAAAFKEVQRRHPALTVGYRLAEDGLVAAPREPSTLEVVDLTDAVDPAALWRRLQEQRLSEPLDLRRTGPFAGTVGLLRDDRADLLLRASHSAVDGRSWEPILRELAELHAPGSRPAHLTSQRATASPGLKRGDAAAQKHWSSMSGASWTAPEPDYPAAVAARSIERRLLDLPHDWPARLAEAARATRATPHVVLLASFAATLAQLCSTRNVLVQSPVALQRPEDDPVGMWTRTVPIALKVSASQSFTDLVAQTRRTVGLAMRHGVVAPSDLLSWTGLVGGGGCSLQLRKVVGGVIEAHDLTMRSVEIVPPHGLEALGLDVVEDPEGRWRLHVEYSTTEYSWSTVGAVVEAWQETTERLLSDPQACLLLGSLPARTPAAAAPVPDLIAEVARHLAADPDHPAVRSLDGSWVTRAELAGAATRAQRTLLANGVGPGHVVAVAVERGPGLVAALHAVLGLGAAFTVLDPETLFPGRAELAVRVARATLILIQDGDARVAPLRRLGVPVAAMNTDHNAPADGGTGPSGHSDWMVRPVPPSALTAVLTTSGSTGEPRAVCLAREGWSSLVSAPGVLELGADDVLVALAPADFDIGVLELLAPGAVGARLVVVTEPRVTAHTLAGWLEDYAATHVHLTAGLLRLFVDEGGRLPKTLRLFLTGGDVVPPQHVRRLLETHPRLRVRTCYGPTENTVFSSVATLHDTEDVGSPLPLGSAPRGRSMSVVGLDGGRVPAAGRGEVAVGGAGLAWGYLGRPRETAALFVPDPDGLPGARRYHTGDHAVTRPDGSTQFLGREDRQLKVSGVRVELGQVEQVLADHPAVSSVVVRSRGPAGDRRLVAHVVATGASANELRAHAAKHLPSQAVPSRFDLRDRLPVTDRGKVDLAALDLDPLTSDTAAVSAGSDAVPAGGVAGTVLACYHAVLGREVGIDDHFLESGGHSLAAMRIAGRLEREGLAVTVREVFEQTTPRRLASLLDARQETFPKPPQPIAPGDHTRRGSADLTAASEAEVALLKMLTEPPKERQ